MADPYGGDGGRAVKQQQGQQRQARLKPALEMEDLISLLHGSDPVRVELTRLENDLHYKEKELGDAQAEIRALRLSERAREKAVEDLTEELAKVDGKLKLTESLLESKNLEAKKINDEKKAAMAAQFAAEATLRRVHAAQKDDDMPPIEAILAPLEAELKLARQELGMNFKVLTCLLLIMLRAVWPVSSEDMGGKAEHAVGALVVLLEDLGQDLSMLPIQVLLCCQSHACGGRWSTSTEPGLARVWLPTEQTWIGTCIIAGTCNGPCRAEGYDNGRCKLINECICCRACPDVAEA